MTRGNFHFRNFLTEKKNFFYNNIIKLGLSLLQIFVQIQCSFASSASELAKACHVLFSWFGFGHGNSSPVSSFLCLIGQEKEASIWRMSFSNGAKLNCSSLNNSETACFRLT